MTMSGRTYKTSEWADILKFYRRRIDDGWQGEPMYEFVKRLAMSQYSSGLHANTSMWTLQIVQTPEYDPDGEILRISYDPALRQFSFEMQETASTLYKRWTRKCAVEEVFRTFERFLQLKKWFVEEKKANV